MASVSNFDLGKQAGVVNFTGDTMYKRVIGLVAVLIIALCVIMGIQRLILHVPPDLSLPPEYMPGQPQPPGVSCSSYGGPYGPYYYMPYAFCTVDKDIWLTLDYHAHTIMYSSIWLYERGLTAGDLVELYGLPLGTTRYGSSLDLVWQDRTAYVQTWQSGFSPLSRVYLVRYAGTDDKYTPWHGWQNAPPGSDMLKYLCQLANCPL